MKNSSKPFENQADIIDKTKQKIRHEIWNLLEQRQVALFPKPVIGRIPNFKGAVEAAKKLRASRQFAQASIVKVNPDSPQKAVRENVLQDGKTLIMPTPRIKHGFLMVKPGKLSHLQIAEAATIAGAFKHGEKIHPRDLPTIDLMVVGSVAVSPNGWRIGKGEGYSEIEFAILKTFGKITDETPIWTTVHDLQIVQEIPFMPYDVPVDRIFTNTKIINCPRNSKPYGILWQCLTKEKIESIPLLEELMEDTF
ncbi:MAG: 5-formyltetrahydrofolate cyclo-ligase [Candidatus Caldarchaeum sp.]